MPEDLDELAAEADRLAALRADGRTPAVVRRACLRRGLTLRGFLWLEEIASPVLTGDWPWADAAAMQARVQEAWEIIFPGSPLPPATDLAGTLHTLCSAVDRAFSTIMPMRWPSESRTRT